MMRTSPQRQQDQNRADYMDFLYKIYQRDQAEPGLLGTFTGLYQQHCEEIGKETVDQQVKYFLRLMDLKLSHAS